LLYWRMRSQSLRAFGIFKVWVLHLFSPVTFHLMTPPRAA
jgi:hypothetical protein